MILNKLEPGPAGFTESATESGCVAAARLESRVLRCGGPPARAMMAAVGGGCQSRCSEPGTGSLVQLCNLKIGIESNTVGLA